MQQKLLSSRCCFNAVIEKEKIPTKEIDSKNVKKISFNRTSKKSKWYKRKKSISAHLTSFFFIVLYI